MQDKMARYRSGKSKSGRKERGRRRDEFVGSRHEEFREDDGDGDDEDNAGGKGGGS
jgi:hypothetical protein